MYIGSTDARGLHHLVNEVIDNAIDEALAGFCTDLRVTIHKDGSMTVADNGRGIPADIHQQTGKPALEVVMTTLHAGGKFEGPSYRVSSGLHGIGVSVVNALSEWLEVEVHRDGGAHRQRYAKGLPTTKVEQIGSAADTGTTVRFKPDNEILEDTNFDFKTIASRLRELAFLNKGLRTTLIDERPQPPKTKTYLFEGGIREYVQYLNESKKPLHDDVIYIAGAKGEVKVEVALQYTAEYGWSIHTFANNVNTKDGGTHLIGFKSALTRCVNDYANDYGILQTEKLDIQGDDVREGLTAIVSVMLPNPQFEGQTKGRFVNTEVRGIVESVFHDGLKTFFAENPGVAQAIVLKVADSARARIAAKEAKELVRKKSLLETATLPGKLADCQSQEPEETELFIVEGPSAGGSAKQGRDRKFQAILPLRGKILNVEKHGSTRMLDNEEIRSLITAIGTGIGESCNLENLRYGKIILMTDADVDGAHIRTLLLTFVYRYMRQLIESERIYIAQPPLYRIRKGDKVHNAMSEKERRKILEDLKGKPDLVQRFKGLGEMNPEELWETTMNPSTRSLLKVTLEDAAEADKIFSTLMGDLVEPRRQFIQENADEVDWLDI